MTLKQALTIACAVFAVAAAVLWFLSARVRIPKRLGYVDLGRVTGEKEEDDIDRVLKGLQHQGRLSSWGATCAAVSAFCQALSLVVPETPA